MNDDKEKKEHDKKSKHLEQVCDKRKNQKGEWPNCCHCFRHSHCEFYGSIETNPEVSLHPKKDASKPEAWEGEKVCSICNKVKSLDKFYVEKKGKFGRDQRCKECSNSISRDRLINKYDPLKEKEKYKKRKADGRMVKLFKDMAKKYPEKNKARYKLRNAVISGKVKKLPCTVCGEVKSQGHHEDYSKPFEVIWMCQKHHSEFHRKSRKLPLVDSSELIRKG